MMEKPIIAVSLTGVLVSSAPWKKAHEQGMKAHAENLGIDFSTINGEDYFNIVEKSLEKIWPDLTPEDRIKKRRKIYFEHVLGFLKSDFDIKQEILDYFSSLKEKYILALVTTNNEKMTQEVLGLLGAGDLFDIVEFSEDDEKDDKEAVLKRLIEKQGKPIILVENKDKLKEFCGEQGIKHVLFDVDTDDLDKLKGEIDGN